MRTERDLECLAWICWRRLKNADRQFAAQDVVWDDRCEMSLVRPLKPDAQIVVGCRSSTSQIIPIV
jgi:hypothetical protein